MRILSRHFLASYLGLFALVLTTSLLLMSVTEMLVNFDEVVEHREEAGGLVAYLLIRVPALYLRDVIPASSFLAAFLSLGLAARSREITALKTGGVAPPRLVLPVIAAAAALSVITLLLNETVLLTITREYARQENDDEPIVFRRGSFWYHRNNTFYNVREADGSSRTLRGVRVFELDPRGRLVSSVGAEEVQIDPEHRWHFLDAVQRRFDPSDPGAPPAVERLPETVVDMASERDLALLDASENTLSLPQLREAIRLRRQEGRDVLHYRARLHARLAEPASVLLFALLAIPVGLGVERTRSLAVSAVQGIALVVLFRVAWQVSGLFAESGFHTAAFGPWLVLAGFGALGAWLLARAPR